MTKTSPANSVPDPDKTAYGFRVPRGPVRIYPPPSLDDPETYHAWQRANEAPTVYSEPRIRTSLCYPDCHPNCPSCHGESVEPEWPLYEQLRRERDAERALADDLAAKLDRTLIALRARLGFNNLVAEGDAALARWREARGR